jgi:hypothetical protein
MADHLGGEDWWDKHRLGYGVVTTVASLQHWASRLKMVASMAKCLLGERSLQFFRFRGPRPRCVGQRDLYPFAILFRELPVERREESQTSSQSSMGITFLRSISANSSSSFETFGIASLHLETASVQLSCAAKSLASVSNR